MLQPGGLPKDGVPRPGSRGLTSAHSARAAALPLLQRVLGGTVPSSPLGGTRRSRRNRAAAPAHSPGGGWAKEAAGGGTPAPRAASPPASGELLGATFSNARGPGPSTGFPGQASPCLTLQPQT